MRKRLERTGRVVCPQFFLAQIEKQIPGEHSRAYAVREHLAGACGEFVNRGLADPLFARELASGSNQKFWACISEALVAGRLRDKNFGKRTTSGEGPDLLVNEWHSQNLG